MVKNLPAMQETQVWSLGLEDPLEKEIATHSGTLAWKIPWTAEPGGLPSMGSHRVRHDWSDLAVAAYLYGLVIFPVFFSLSLNFAMSSWSEPQSLPRLVFCWLYRASPSLAEKNIIYVISVLTIWWCPCIESSLVLLEEGVCYDQCLFLT